MAAAADIPAQGVSPGTLERLMPPVLGASPVPAAAIAFSDRRILTANSAWRRMAAAFGAGEAGSSLGSLFPAATGFLDDKLLTAGAIIRRAVPAIVPPGGVATWWDLEIVPYPDQPGIAMVTARDTTAHVLTQREAEDERQALSASGVRLGLAQAATGIGMWEWNLATDTQSWSPTQFRLFGLDPARDKPPGFAAFIDAVHPDDRAAIVSALDTGFTTGHGPDQVEFRLSRADTGQERWILARGRAISVGLDGKPIRIVGVNIDITKQRHAQAALRASDERLRMAFEAAQMFAWDWDLLTGQVTWTEGGEKALGMPPGGFGGTVEHFRALVHPGDAARVEDTLGRALRAETPRYEVEFRMRRADGTWRWSKTIGQVTRNPMGEPVRVVGVDYDVTEQRKTETELRDSRSRFESLFDGMFQYTGLLALDGTVLKANRAAISFGGLPLDQVIGKKLWQVYWFSESPDTEAAVQQAVEAAAAGAFVRYETEVRGVSRRAVIDFSLQPVRGDDGAVIMLAAEGRDISAFAAERDAAVMRTADLEALLAERTRALADAGRELETEMRRRADLQSTLLQAQKLGALGELTGSVAHDFNNVLAAITGSYSLIRRKVQSEPILDIVTRGEQAAARASALIQQILAFVRREELTPEMLDVAGVLRELQDLICHAAGQGVDCTLDVRSGLWPVLADSHQLGIAILNLAVNARDAMPGGGALTVTARNLAPEERPESLPAGNYISIAVRDGGEGMSPEVLERAREPFFTTKAEGKGTGLGLSMVHGFAAKAGGTLRIESALGAGTTVEIVLPHAAIVASSTERKHALRQISPQHYILHGDATILLVETDEQLRPMTANYLRDLGYHVAEAASAEAAYALFHALGRVDLVVTDLCLPGEDGVTLARRLCAEDNRLQVLFATGLHGISAADTGMILQKPYLDTALARAVLQSLGRKVSVDSAVAEPMLSRMSSEAMRSILMAWHVAKADGEGFPRLGVLDPDEYGLGPNAFTAEVQNTMPPSFRYLRMGSALSDELHRHGSAESGGTGPDKDELIGTLDGAYRRCARTRSPVYQSAEYEFGDGAPFHFERLILPAAQDGQTITHLIGIVLFETRIGDELL